MSMPEKTDLDLVHILTPPQFHKDIALDCGAAKKHTYIEKPVATCSKDAKLIDKTFKENKVKLCVGHNLLFNDVMLEARNLLCDGSIGDVVFVHSWYGTQFGAKAPPFPPEYWGYKLPGSLYHDYLPHPLYVTLDFIENAQIKNAFTKSLGIVPYMDSDELKVSIENETGFGMISLSLSVFPRYHFIDVYGTAGSMRVDFLNNIVQYEPGGGMLPPTIGMGITNIKKSLQLPWASVKTITGLLRGKFSLFNGSERLIKLFYRSVLLDEESPVSGSEGIQVTGMMDKIWDLIDNSK